jgi:catechol 2,3-dioxygenase-like lactoylglutathione lyase family enzyme
MGTEATTSGTPPSPEPRRMRILGLHHVTLICRDLERTTAFYRDLLGLAVVQEGVNEDDPGARHFWFSSDPDGTPGTLLSFLEYATLPDGVAGAGSTHHLALAVGSREELGAWVTYLRDRGVPCTDVMDRGRFRSVYLRDPDGHILEIATR